MYNPQRYFLAIVKIKRLFILVVVVVVFETNAYERPLDPTTIVASMAIFF
jgi:hypothetical protein